MHQKASLVLLLLALASPVRAMLVQRGQLRGTDRQYSLVIPIDNTGIADWSFLNPRRPVYVFGSLADVARRLEQEASRTTDPVASERLRSDALAIGNLLDPSTRLPTGVDSPSVQLQFINRTSSRTVTVSLKLPAPGAYPERGSDVAGEAGDETRCRTRDGECEFFLTIGPGGSGFIDVARMVRILAHPPTGPADGLKKAQTFVVSFFREDQEPANPRGYIALVDADLVQPPAPTSELAATFTLRSQRDPDFGQDDATLVAPDRPYEGKWRSHYPADSRVSLTRTLGDRARGEIDVRYKRGSLGGEEAGNALSVLKYKVDVFNVIGLVLTFGRFDMAKPTDGLAIQESGEGFRLSYRNGGLSYLVKRESDTRVPDAANNDSSSWIVQLNNIAPAAWPAIHRLSLIGLYGREEHSDDPTDTSISEPKRVRAHWYGTGGVELGFGVPIVKARGTAGLYHSRRGALSGSGLADGHGTSTLVTLTRTFVTQERGSEKKSVRRSFTLLGGYGTGDKPGTGVDEGYIGESAGYAEDRLFLSSFVSRLDHGTRKAVGPGMSNKTFLGATFVDNTISPLEWVAERLGAHGDIESRATILRVQHYRLNEPLGDRHGLGTEVSAEFQVETPKGVKVSLVAARFFAGSGMDALLHSGPWLLSAGVSLKL